jgi:pyridoxine 4-dehydrogenase
MTWKPKPTSDEQAFEAIKLAVDGGSNMLNSGEVRWSRTAVSIEA